MYLVSSTGIERYSCMQYSIKIETIVENNFVAYSIYIPHCRIFLGLIIMEKIFHSGLCVELLLARIILIVIIIIFIDTILGRVYIFFKC